MALTPQQMLARMVEQLPGKTGKDYDAWVTLAQGAGIHSHKALTAWLKAEHGLDHNQAQWIAWGVTDPGRLSSYEKPKDLVDELYSGKKAHLRPLYDALLAAALGLGPDVRPNVCRTYTSVARGTQFALLHPSTNAAIDLELALPPAGRREGFKSSNPRFQSRIRLRAVEELDDEVLASLREAWAAVS